MMPLKILDRKQARGLRSKCTSIDHFGKFVEDVRLKRVNLLGITDAAHVGAVGMNHYLLWQKDSGRVWASYVGESHKEILNQF